MFVPQHPTVVVVVYDDQVHSGIARCALKHRWEILDGRTERSLCKRIMLAHPRAILTQIPTPAEPATGLIDRLRQLFTPPAILAVATVHSEQAEAAVRAAGANAYLTESARPEQIEQALRAIAPGALPSDAQVEAKADPAGPRAARSRMRRSPRLAPPDALAPVRHSRRAT